MVALGREAPDRAARWRVLARPPAYQHPVLYGCSRSSAARSCGLNSRRLNGVLPDALTQWEESIMTRLIKVVPAVALLLGLGTAAMAAPIPVLSIAQDSAYELVAAEKSSRVESTKAWLRTKKTQT